VSVPKREVWGETPCRSTHYAGNKEDKTTIDNRGRGGCVTADESGGGREGSTGTAPLRIKTASTGVAERTDRGVKAAGSQAGVAKHREVKSVRVA